jgi:hypothetical protein
MQDHGGENIVRRPSPSPVAGTSRVSRTWPPDVAHEQIFSCFKLMHTAERVPVAGVEGGIMPASSVAIRSPMLGTCFRWRHALCGATPAHKSRCINNGMKDVQCVTAWMRISTAVWLARIRKAYSAQLQALSECDIHLEVPTGINSSTVCPQCPAAWEGWVKG